MYKSMSVSVEFEIECLYGSGGHNREGKNRMLVGHGLDMSNEVRLCVSE